MTILKTAAVCLAFALAAGSAQAQTGSTQGGAMQSDGAMKSDSAMSSGGMMSEDHMMAKRPSAADMRMMKSCKGMSHAAMMKNKGCMRMMKMHPDMMKKG